MYKDVKTKDGLIPMSVIFIKDYLNELTRIYEEADTLIKQDEWCAM